MVPFWILVEMPSAWKKDVCEGSSAVGPASMCTSHCASAPARAAAGRRNSSIFDLMPCSTLHHELAAILFVHCQTAGTAGLPEYGRCAT